MNKSLGYIITAIASMIAGWFLYSSTHKKTPKKESFNKTVLTIKDGKYFLTYENIVPLSREITKEEYDSFIKQYPSGEAPLNVLDQFSSHPPKYTIKGSKYYEYIWDGEKYGNGLEITKEEYCFLTNRQTLSDFHF